jgi:hypothetical protein
MADAGWDLGETIFIGANDEAASNATGITRRDAEDGFYNFLVSFRDAENSFVYRCVTCMCCSPLTGLHAREHFGN